MRCTSESPGQPVQAHPPISIPSPAHFTSVGQCYWSYFLELLGQKENKTTTML